MARAGSRYKVIPSAHVIGEAPMATAVVVKSSEGVTVRLPEDIGLPEGEVEIYRRGDEVVLKDPRSFGQQVIDAIRSMPEDMFEGIKDNRPPEEREGL